MEIEFPHDEPLLDKDSDPVRARPPHAIPLIMEVAIEQSVLVVGVTAGLNAFPPLLTLTNTHSAT